MSFTTRQKMIIEACVRITLCDLLEKDQDTIEDFTAVLFNINQGGFGKKDYKFDNACDWLSCLEEMRNILQILDPAYYELGLKLGAIPFRLPEEDTTCCVSLGNTDITKDINS